MKFEYEQWKDAIKEKPGSYEVLASYMMRNGYRNIVKARYIIAETFICPCDDTETCGCEYDKYTDEHFLPEGWYETNANSEQYFTPIAEGTVKLWCKLPKLPEV